MSIEGIYKGYYNTKKKQPRQETVFCYGYLRKGKKPFFRDEWLYQWVAGTRKLPIWEREGGVKKWIAEMPSAVLTEQFISTPPPIVPNEEIGEAFLRQSAYAGTGDS